MDIGDPIRKIEVIPQPREEPVRREAPPQREAPIPEKAPERLPEKVPA